MARQTLGCCTPTYNSEIRDDPKVSLRTPGPRVRSRPDNVASGTFRTAGWLFPMPLFNHAFRVFSRLFPVLAAFIAIAGTGVIRTGLWLGVIVW